MNRWLWIGSLAGLLIMFTGCASTCSTGGCSSGSCATGACASSGSCGGGCNSGSCNGGSGLGASLGRPMGQLAGVLGCNGGAGCGRTGCMTGPMGWQSGGLDYSSHLQSGMLGHTAAQNLNSRPFTPGPPTGQVAYPYYTVRGPRDFLLDQPATIGR